MRGSARQDVPACAALPITSRIHARYPGAVAWGRNTLSAFEQGDALRVFALRR